MDYQSEHADMPLEAWKKAITFLTDEQKKPLGEVQRYPAIFINRTNAQKYAESVGGRLPTEAEWEFAARSGGQERRWAGKLQVVKKSFPKARLFSSANAGEMFPVPVRSFAGEDETDQKVFDMTGNVREWCLDVYKPYPTIISEHNNPAQARVNDVLHDPREGGEPEKAESKQMYVVRGGSFRSEPDEARTFQRNAVAAYEELYDLGFRVVLQCPPEGP
jgi:formylglycine-generating enzyme required for sulfatase activity